MSPSSVCLPFAVCFLLGCVLLLLLSLLIVQIIFSFLTEHLPSITHSSCSRTAQLAPPLPRFQRAGVSFALRDVFFGDSSSETFLGFSEKLRLATCPHSRPTNPDAKIRNEKSRSFATFACAASLASSLVVSQSCNDASLRLGTHPPLPNVWTHMGLC